jgi:hypothetical protein
LKQKKIPKNSAHTAFRARRLLVFFEYPQCLHTFQAQCKKIVYSVLAHPFAVVAHNGSEFLNSPRLSLPVNCRGDFLKSLASQLINMIECRLDAEVSLLFSPFPAPGCQITVFQ